MTEQRAQDERLEGELTSWDDGRGFGFISPSGGTRRIFVHISAFPRRSDRPQLGDLVTFEVGTSASGKPEAVAVQRTRAAASAPPVSGNDDGNGNGNGDSDRDSDGDDRLVRELYRRKRGAQNLVSYVVIVAFAVLYFVVNIYWDVPGWVGALYLIASAFSFVVYSLDKNAAVGGRWRTSESTLLAIGLLGGWPGAIVAQQVLRHKTRKRSFQIAFYGCVALNVIAFVTFTSPGVSGLLR